MKKLFILFSSFIMFSCGSEVPDGILGKEEMGSIYWDLLRADEMVNYLATADTAYNREKNQDSLYSAIFLIHDISKMEFLKSKAYYEAHPGLLKPVLDSIYSNGERLQNLPVDTPGKKPASNDTSTAGIASADSSSTRKGLILKRE